jgi:GxxExxY protein
VVKSARHKRKEFVLDTNTLTGSIIGCAIKVSNKLGNSFLERVYENAMMIELARAGLFAEQQKPLSVLYDGHVVGDFHVDILVNETVICELKATKEINERHQAQLLNYLKASGLSLGLILNFGTPKLGIKRMKL